jgi:CheY-like chemotaxis protein
MKSLNSLYVVDDDVMYQYIARQIIESTSMVKQISLFSNGREAIDALESHADSTMELPDLILLDLMMPVCDGWGFLKGFEEMKSRLHKSIPIYIVSTSFNPLDVDRAKTIGDVTGYMVKPITRDKFVEILSSQ